MTIYDISEKAGVSIATVSRVLNGSNNVSESTKQKVLKIMEEYGYTPNAFARGLGLNTMKTIGIMCADSSDLYLAKAIYYIEGNLRSHGYDSILCCSGYDLETKISSLNLLLTKKVDSIILVGSNFIYDNPKDNQYIIDAAKQIPVMLLNAYLDLKNVYSIFSDDYTSTFNATKLLIDNGCKNLLYFYNSKTYSAKKKIAGFMDAMAACQRKADENTTLLFQGSHEDIPAMAAQIKAFSEKGHVFDGIIAADDYLALGAIKYANENNVCIPEDLSIIGHNNSMLVSCCHPELSSIDNKLELLCEQLTTTLMDVLNGNEVEQKYEYTAELILRGTTKN